MSTPKNFSQGKFRSIPPDAERRKQQALQRLGCDTPRCGLCGEADPRCLELHHIAGQAYDGTLAPLCRNCHRKASDLQREHPLKIANEVTLAERVAHFLLGLADLFALLVETCRTFAVALLDYVREQSAGSASSTLEGRT
ncbi:HNH endonuclease [Acidocella sp.]|uniref:HNH endonuclease n=1 Tax=Acidocella sp. TaxID=50710 RepID=UPI00262CA9D2|nr:HNH endonuclease signature motif containing protein [Acidocella sp.]